MHKVPSVAYAVDMDFNAYRRQVEASGNREVGRLSADARQFTELLHGIRQNAAETLLQHFGQCLQVTCLVMVEASG